MAYLLYEYLLKTGYPDPPFDRDTGLIQLTDGAISVDRLIQQAFVNKRAIKYGEVDMKTALDNIQGPLSTLAGILSSKMEPGYTLALRPSEDRTTADLYKEIIIKAILKLLVKPAYRPKKPLLAKVASANLKNYFTKDSLTFIRDVLTDPLIQTRVKNLPKAKLWQGVIEEISNQLQIDPTLFQEQISLDPVQVKEPGAINEHPLNQKRKAIQELIQTIEDQMKVLIGTEEGRKEAKRLSLLLKNLEDAKDVDILTTGIKEAFAQIKKAEATIYSALSGKDISLSALDQAYGIASAYSRYLDTVSQLISRNTAIREAVGSEIQQSVKDAISISSSVKREYVEIVIPIIAKQLMPVNTRTLSEVKESLVRSFGAWAFENKQKYPSRNEYEVALQKHIDDNLEATLAENQQKSLTFISERLRQNLGGDISKFRAFTTAIQYAGDDVLAMAKMMMDRAYDDVRTDYLSFEHQLHKKLMALQALRGTEDPLKLFEEIIEKDSKGRVTNYIVSEFRLAEFNQAQREYREELDKIDDPVERRKKAIEWKARNIERMYMDEFYERVNEIIGPERQKAAYKKISVKISEIENVYRNPDGTVDGTAISEEDRHNLKVLYEKRAKLRNKLTSAEYKKLQELVYFDEKESFAIAKEKMRKELSEEDYNKWFDDQFYKDSASGELRLLSFWTEMVPKDKAYFNPEYKGPGIPRKSVWGNNQYATLMALPADSPIREFYDLFISQQQANDKGRPYYAKMGYRIPTMRKNLVELTKDQGSLGQKFAFLKQEVTKTQDDTDYGLVYEGLEEGETSNKIPLFYTDAVKLYGDDRQYGVPIEVMSFDLAGVLAANTWNSLRYQHTSAIAPELEGIRRILAERPTQGVDMAGRLMRRFTGQRHMIKDGKSTNAYELYKNFLDKELYGRRKHDEKFLGLHAEVWDNMMNYNSVLLLGGNLRNAVINLTQGQLILNLEASSGGLISRKSLNKAYGQHTADITNGSIIDDLGSLTKRARTNILMQELDAQNEFDGPRFNYSQDSKLKRLLISTDIFHVINAIPEHFIASISMHSVLNDIKMKNAEGKYIDIEGNEVPKSKAMSMNDAISIEDGKMVMNPHAAKFELRNMTHAADKAGVFRITQYIRGVNYKLQGAYSNQNKGEIYRHVVGRMLMQMRGWLIPTFDTRWRGFGTVLETFAGKEQSDISFDYQTMESMEGNYVTTLKFLYKVFVGIKELGLREGFKDARMTMTEAEMARFRHTLLDVMVFTGAILLANLVLDMADDEDDPWLYFLASVLVRLKSELSFYVNPVEAGRILRSPAATLSTIENMTKLLYQALPPNIGEEYETTWRKGELKIKKNAEELIPFFRHARELGHSEDILKYYVM